MVTYRQRALEHRNRQDRTDALRRITAPHEWLIVVALILSILAALTAGAFWRMPVSPFADDVPLPDALPATAEQTGAPAAPSSSTLSPTGWRTR